MSYSCRNQEGGASDALNLTADAIEDINPMAFNAFELWRAGRGTEVLNYPENYDRAEGAITPDGVFYADPLVFFQDGFFVAVPTEGAKVLSDVLEYPLKNGKKLKLKFSNESEVDLTHAQAVQHCKSAGQRLPTAREIFDFCAVGVKEPNYGPDFIMGQYPPSARCGGKRLWSSSLDARVLSDARRFFSKTGEVKYWPRHQSSTALCVGA